MAYGYGLGGLVTFTSAGALPISIRVFDFALGTSGAAAGAVLWALSAAGDTAGTFPVLNIKAGGALNSNAGLRFPNGIWVAGGTSTVNYITEF
jgi:hypothetical protein